MYLRKLTSDTQHHASLRSLVVDDGTLNQAFQWLCRQRINYSHNSDIWDFIQNWKHRKADFIAQVMSGDYQFSPLQRYHINGETLSCWSAQDAMLLKAMTLVLQDHLGLRLPACCFHLVGAGGIKQALSQVKTQLHPG
ncbi:MAG TPA: hypothetical protein ENJ32_07930 [Crenotrichaceae bacterium]|nr:hypothetical protein [Crenotrichaceae bacterium]